MKKIKIFNLTSLIMISVLTLIISSSVVQARQMVTRIPDLKIVMRNGGLPGGKPSRLLALRVEGDIFNGQKVRIEKTKLSNTSVETIRLVFSISSCNPYPPTIYFLKRYSHIYFFEDESANPVTSDAACGKWEVGFVLSEELRAEAEPGRQHHGLIFPSAQWTRPFSSAQDILDFDRRQPPPENLEGTYHLSIRPNGSRIIDADLLISKKKNHYVAMESVQKIE